MHSSSLPEPSPSQIHGRLLYKCCLSSCFGEVDLWNSQGPPAKAPKLFRSQPNSSSKKKLFQVYVSAEERVWVDRKDFPPEGFFFFPFLSTQTILCRGLSYCWLQIQILSIYCSWLLCVVRKLKFAAGPFILANHADIKSLKASEWPLRVLTQHFSSADIVLLVFSACASWVLSPCCFQPQRQTVMGHFVIPDQHLQEAALVLSPATSWTCLLRGGQVFVQLPGVEGTHTHIPGAGGCVSTALPPLARGLQSRWFPERRI